MRLVSVDMITPDMTIAFPVYSKNTLVINAGRNNIARYIPNLMNMGIQYVYVEDELSKGIMIPDAISVKTRNNCKYVLRNMIFEYAESSNVNLYPLSDSIENVINEVLENEEVQVSLNDIGTVDEHTYLHSVNVSVYSLLIGKALHYSRRKLQELAMGTMLHDIGKTLVKPGIQFKEGNLTPQEYEEMKKHAEIGYYILSKSGKLPEEVRQVALNHHERLDGRGYPRGKTGREIHEYARIASIADVYDALTSDRAYKKKWSAEEAINFLIEHSGTMFSPELVQLFIQQVAIYPNGSMVSLSDGGVAIVKEQNRHVPMRPIVRVIQDAQGNKITPFEIDLMKVLSITITQSQLEIGDQSDKRIGLDFL